MYNIVTNKLQNIKELKLIDTTNINKIIDSTNAMTALHYAAQLSDGEIERYLLTIGGNPAIKNKYGKDAYDISITFNKRILFDIKIQKLQAEKTDLKTEIENLKKRSNDQADMIEYANAACQNYKNKWQKNSLENNFLNIELNSQKATNALLSKEIINKDAKIEKFDATIENFIKNNKKK